MEAAAAAMTGRAQQAAAGGSRYVVAIAGPPGAGKSTVAEVVLRHGREAGLDPVVVGMDGWHLAHRVLVGLGLETVKGAPETFDAHGFVNAVRRISVQRPGDPTLWFPEFRRDLEEPVAGAIGVSDENRLVVVEGNYLLLDESPWREAIPLYDETWMLTPRPEKRRARLAARHEQYGRSPEEARAHALGSDERNAERILQSPVRPETCLVDPG